MNRVLIASLIATAVFASAGVTASASHGAGHPDWSCCGAVVSFAKDFPALKDSEWKYPLGGWGGIKAGAPIKRTPVIFVHGNGEDASFFDLQNESNVAVNVRRRFRDAGYTDQELWALSYNGQRCGNNTCQTYNEVNVPDFVAFTRAVLAYTGAKKVDIVAHSLGVTIVRRSLQVHPDLLGKVEDVVLASGANHGTSACRGSESLIGCHEIAPGTPWLAELNKGDETPGAARYVTICDCTGAADHFFVGVDARSPVLDGADNREVAGSLHFMTARGPDVLPLYLPLVKRTSNGSDPSSGSVVRGLVSRDGETLPATGVTNRILLGLLILGSALVVAAIALARRRR